MTLRALLVCLCVLVLGTQATAATKQVQPTNATRTAKVHATRTPATPVLATRLGTQLDAVRKHRGTMRFFDTRPWLLRSKKHAAHAQASLRRAELRLARAERAVAWLRGVIRTREQRRLRGLPPRKAICTVFGSYCRQALSVAWCESRFDPGARNGQYLGLFQMGSYERSLFGHGATPHAQAAAAHAYFVRSGRDWSPWSCKPGHAYT